MTAICPRKRDASVKKVYVVDSTPEEREELMGLLRGGQARVRMTNRARILLLADEGRTDAEVAEVLLTSVSTVERSRERFVEGGLERALNEHDITRTVTSMCVSR